MSYTRKIFVNEQDNSSSAYRRKCGHVFLGHSVVFRDYNNAQYVMLYRNIIDSVQTFTHQRLTITTAMTEDNKTPHTNDPTAIPATAPVPHEYKSIFIIHSYILTNHDHHHHHHHHHVFY